MEEIIFNVKTNTGNTVSDLKKVNKEEVDLKKNADAAASSVETQFDALNKKVALGGLTFRETNKVIKEYQTIALQAGAESPIGKAAIENAGRLKDELGDLSAQVNVMATDGANLQAALQLGSTVTAGYGALQGTMALVGGESEELEKSMQKLIAVQTVLNSVETIRAALEKESFLRQKASVLWTNLQSVASKNLTIAQIAQNGVTGITTAVTGAATVAMAALNAVMLLNPVFLLIAAFAALAAGFVLFSGSADHAAEDNERLNASFEKSNELLEINNERMIRSANNRLKQAQAEGASEEELLQKRLTVLKVEETARKKNMDEIKRQADERIKVLQTAINEDDKETRKAAEDELRNLISKHKKLRSQDGQYYADKKAMITQFNREQRELEAKDAEASLNAQILQARGNFGKQQSLRKDLAKQERDNALKDVNLGEGQKLLIQQQYEQKVLDLNKESAEKAKSARAERLAKEKEAENKRLEYQRLIADLAIENIEDEWQRRFTLLAVNQQRERDDLIAKYGKDTELMKQLEINQTNELMALDEEQRKAAESKEKEASDKAAENAYNDRKAKLEGLLILNREEFEAQQELQAELALLERERALENENLTEGEKFKIQEEYAAKISSLEDERLAKEEETNEAIKASRKEMTDAIIGGAQEGNNLLQGLSDAIFSYQLDNVEKGSAQELAVKKKQFEVNKKLQIVNAAIQGVQAVLAAYSSGSAIPVVGAVTGPLFAALAAATVITQIAKIKNSTFEGGSAGSISPPSQSAPNLNALGANGTTDTAALQNGTGQNQNGPPNPIQPLVVLPIDSLKKVQDQSNQSQQIATIGG